MTFEEEFPSFKEDGRWQPTMLHSSPSWREEAIKEHCLDKQRVKDAIEKCKFKFDKDVSMSGDLSSKRLLKELCLDGDE